MKFGILEIKTNRLLAICFLTAMITAALFLPASCIVDRSGIGTDSRLSQTVEPYFGSDTTELKLVTIIADAENYPVPSAVDADTFELLRAEFIRLIGERGQTKYTSTVSVDSGRVKTLATVGNDGGAQIMWEAHLEGDTDCDGEVTVADITPIALRYLNRADDGIEDGYDEVVDTDRDEEIGIADITPIAFNYLARIDGYNVYRRDTPSATPVLVGSTAFKTPSQSGGAVDIYTFGERSNVYVLTDPDIGTNAGYYEVRPVSGAEEIYDGNENLIYYEPFNLLRSPNTDPLNLVTPDRDEEIGLLRDQLIVNFNESATLGGMISAVYSTGIGAHVAGKLSKGDGLQLITNTDVELLAADMTTLAENSLVDDVQNNHILPAPDMDRTPSFANPDPLRDGQWNLFAINAENGWDYCLPDGSAGGGEGALIAFIDTGVDSLNPEFEGKLSPFSIYIDGKPNAADSLFDSGYIIDTQGHGTAVAGVAAAAQNGIGMSGVAFDSEILVIKVGFEASDGNWYMPASSIAEGIYYAVSKNAAVINLPNAVNTNPGTVVHRAIQFAVAQNIPVVCPAGDYNANADLIFPASFAESFTVGATDLDNTKASFSNFGSCVAVAAPGYQITSIDNAGDYKSYSRTTMASAQVAGLVAMIRAIAPTMSPNDIRNVISSNVTPLSPTLGIGSGIIDVEATMSEVPGAVLPPSDWHYETADAEQNVGWYCGIAIDSLNRPHVSYLDSHNADLKYAHKIGTTWQATTVDSDGNVGEATSIALDKSGKPHISYTVLGSGDLKHAYFNGSDWQVETVDLTGGGGAEQTSIAVDSNDRPHISYTHIGNGDLKYAAYDGSLWQIEVVDSNGDVGTYPDIAIDSSDKPHISYYDSNSADLKYAYFDGGSWTLETVDNEVNVGSYTSIALDSNIRPHISYYDDTNMDLKYANYDGSAWQISVIDSFGEVGPSTSLALDESDKPHISYYDLTNEDLKYAYYDGAVWQLVKLDSSGRLGWSTSIALDSRGRPNIVYTDSTSDCILEYVWFGF